MINVDWAYSGNEVEKARSNFEKYLEIKDQATTATLETGYSYRLVRVDVKDGYTLTDEQKALIADNGNLCFGYDKVSENTYKIYTD